MRLLPSRYFGRAHGQHRKGQPVPHPPFGAVVDQRIVHCPTCGPATSATVHGQVLRCAEGHEIGGQP